MAKPLPERDEIYVARQVEGFFWPQGRHRFMIAEFSMFFCYGRHLQAV
ncbi:hypothetical protein [Actinomadura litoris]|nr:hypothetical protein [Actinomadura litoris]